MKRTTGLAVALVGLLACSRSDPPGASDAATPSVAPLPASLASLPAAAPPPEARAPHDAGAGSAASASASASAADAAAAESEPGKLPQTKDKPEPSGPTFEAHVAELWDAIVNDAPDRAAPFFFPVDAYAQIKDIPNPPADWKGRLMRAYVHDIHALHARLGANAASAKFLRIEVPNERATWVKPHEEMNTGSYWRVFGTQVHYEVDGKERTFDVKSMISWRGEWYVVHLSAIK